MPATVAILPFPLSPAALFGYGILRFLGQIDENTHNRFTSVSCPHTDMISCEEKIVDLRLKERPLYEKMSALVDPYTLKHTLSFASFGQASFADNHEVHGALESVLKKLTTENSHVALSLIPDLIRRFVESHTSTWKSTEGLKALVDILRSLELHSNVALYPPDERPLTMPVFKGKDKPQDKVRVVLREGRICSLHKHIGIVVGGPSGSGKSVLAPSLIAEMNDWIGSFDKRAAFTDFRLNARLSGLDLGTPTADAIAEGWGNDRERLLSRKQPWTMNLARRAQRKFLNSREKYHITIADLPGRIDDITRLLVAPADAAIIITNDWSLALNEWFPFMKYMWVP